MAALIISPNEVTMRVARAFEKLSIGYYLCGSFASGFVGSIAPRPNPKAMPP